MYKSSIMYSSTSASCHDEMFDLTGYLLRLVPCRGFWEFIYMLLGVHVFHKGPSLIKLFPTAKTCPQIYLKGVTTSGREHVAQKCVKLTVYMFMYMYIKYFVNY